MSRRAICSVLTCVAMLGAVAPQAHGVTENTNNYSFMLDVWTANVENLQNVTASGQCFATFGMADPAPLVNAMAARYYTPDIVLIQQIDGHETYGHYQLRKLVDAMNAKFASSNPGLHSTYRSMVAEHDPAPMAVTATQPAGCQNKRWQTNAIIYRSNRLTYDDGTRFPYQSILNQSGCGSVSGQSRTMNVRARFTDTKASYKKVNATSILWPSFNPLTQPSCGVQNASRASTYSQDSATHLNIVGGDTNIKVSENSAWYQSMGAAGGGYGFREAFPAYENSTRLDYLFARNPARSPKTIYAPEIVGGVHGHAPVHGWVYY
jgi:hypothetical protein